MKRIQLFEFEDLHWFPDWIRRCMTRLIVVVHRLIKTDEHLSGLVADVLKETNQRNIIDLCSGSGGPMPDVVQILKEDHHLDVKLTLTDLFPNQAAAKRINGQQENISYHTDPIDATQVDESMHGLRTMVGSFHHMKPDQARKILTSAYQSRQPICIFEISDNSAPTFLWWIAIPVNIVMCLFITPMVRPMTWQQLVFTYLIPIIPILFAWDGAASNARTYTLKDMDQLLKGLNTDGYEWKKGAIKGMSKKLYLIGKPAQS